MDPAEWQAFAAVVAAVATIGLALIAVGQMRATRHAAEETRRSAIQPLVYAHAITRDAGAELGIVAFPTTCVTTASAPP